MSTPVIESIAIDIETAINAVTEANGFNQDLTAIRPARNDFKDVTPEDRKVLIWQGDEERPDDHAIDTQEWMQPFVLEAVVLDDDNASDSIDTRINQVRADIQKKLCEDVTRGGNAIDTILMPCGKFDDGEGFTGIAVNIIVHYRTNDDDPYTKA